jgi:hypothetical protein
MDYVNREELTTAATVNDLSQKFVVELAELELLLAGGGMGDTQL